MTNQTEDAPVISAAYSLEDSEKKNEKPPVSAAFRPNPPRLELCLPLATQASKGTYLKVADLGGCPTTAIKTHKGHFNTTSITDEGSSVGV